MYDMLILAAPVAVIGFSCLTLLLIVLRKWRWALSMFFITVVLNCWTQQIPLNLHRTVAKALTPVHKAFPDYKEEETLRIFEYNICGKVEYVPVHGEEFINYVLGLNADILFLPENHPWTANELDDTLKARYPYYMQMFEHDYVWVGEHSIYSRYPLSKPRFYTLDFEKIIRENPTLDTLFIRRLGSHPLIYEAEADINGHPVTLVHLHLRSNSYDDAKANGSGRKQKVHNIYENLKFGYTYRRYESQLLYDSLWQCPNPLIVCGDFNDLSGSHALQKIQNCREKNPDLQHRDRLQDAWWEGGTGFGFTFDDQHLLLRLDHLLYSKEFELQQIDVPDVNYSDHRPIVADFKFYPNNTIY